ncbi:transposase family protein [Micromonospora arborensis]|uniref:transposase family protein n=1 Tax=Micromonospora arborensis TaxID=2116518 RepID=UPI0037183308
MTAATSRSWPCRTGGRCGLPGVRPGREHDTTAARADPVLLHRIRDWATDGSLALADLGYEGGADLLRIPIKKTTGTELTIDQLTFNAVHGALRCRGERRTFHCWKFRPLHG